MKSFFFFFFITLFCSSQIYSQPSITSFSPSSGAVGTTVVINGTNYSAIPANNIVYFGAVRATVTAATATSLTVTVPNGATCQPLSVTTGNLIAWSNVPFIPTFQGGGAINSTAFFNPFPLDTVSTGDFDTNGLAIADLDGDGRPDAAVVDRVNNTVSLFRNRTSANELSFDAKLDLNTGKEPTSVTVGDLDGDGKFELIVANGDINTSSISVYKNNSTANNFSFSSPKSIAAGTQPLALFVTDFDKDGKSDIAIANVDVPGYITLLRNITSGGVILFAPKQSIAVAGTFNDVKAADLDGDRKPDLVFSNYVLNVISVLRNTSTSGNISFATPQSFSTGSFPAGLTIGDMDADGKADVAVANLISNSVSLFKNTSISGAISFAAKANLGSLDSPTDVTLSDVDGDGKVDLLVSDANNIRSHAVSVLKNHSVTGSISFATKEDFAIVGSKNIAAADFDMDGRQDFIVSGSIFRGVILRNRIGAPDVASFSPTSAAPGSTVTISGSNFTGTTAVSFGGVAASSFTVVSASTIEAVVSENGVSGDVVVSSPKGYSSLAAFVFAAPPILASFTPKTALAGTTITINGKNFTNATAVSFGGVPASSFSVISPGTITAIVGSGASGSVSLATPYGKASLPGFVFTTPPPTVTSFSPSFGGVGTRVSIAGTNLNGTASVSFGGVPATSFTVVSDETIMATVGSGGSGNVSVTTGSGTASRPGFIYVPPPAVTSFTPSSAKFGTTITIIGNNFNNVTGVSFGGVPPLYFDIVSGTTIRATIGKSASGNVVVTSPYGSSSLNGFTFLPAPTVTSFTPQSGPPGTTVTITGTDFTGATSVHFNGQAAKSFTVVSSTTIQAVTGSGQTGKIQVTTPNGFGYPDSYYTFIYPPPTVTSFSPASATTGDKVNITGTNFINFSSVSFGGVAASSVIVNSSTSITATVGPGASGNVSVNTAGGKASLPGFTFTQPPPSISSFYPSYAASNQSVSITGNNFLNTTDVSFGGVSAASFVVNSNTSITAIVGDGASGNLTVTTATGVANTAYFNYGNPRITSFSPTSAAAGTMVTITGSGFYNVLSVKFGGVNAASYTVNSLNSITAVVGAGATGDVTVMTQVTSGRIEGFTFLSPTPAIRSVVPGVATVGAAVKITGNKFSGTTAVSFGGVPATSFIVHSDSLIEAIVGTGASGDVSVTTPLGAVTYPGFIYTNAPVIASIFPDAAPVGASVTISGFNFNPSSTGNIVYFGSVKAPILSASSTTLIVTVPMGASYRPVSVTSNGLTTYSSKPFDVLFTSLGILNANAFAAKIDSATGRKPNDIAIADMDVDGKNDVAVAVGDPSSNLSLFQNTSTPGIVSFAMKKTITHNSGPEQTVFSDIDGDGKLDMIVANNADKNGVSLYRNTSTNGNISFANEYLFDKLRLGYFYVAADDLDGDGKTDIAVLSPYSKEISIYKNTGRPGEISFAVPVTKPVSNFGTSIVIVDIDLDAKPDLVISTVRGNTGLDGHLYIYRNTSSATAISFAISDAFSTSGGAASLAVADMDGDGKSDVMVTNRYLNTFSYLRNVSSVGNIAMQNKVEFFTAQNPVGITVADLDGNNKPDIVITNNGNSSVSVFRNTSSNNILSFAPKFQLATGDGPYAVTVGDMDSDGKPDILTANEKAGSVSVLRNLIDVFYVKSFNPMSGAKGTVVTIKGAHFTGATAVSFGGVAAASFTVQNDSTITAVVANGSTGGVMVKTAAGEHSLPTFTYTCDPVKVPTISLIRDSILVSSPANYYQWYLNSNKLPNAVSGSLIFKTAGFYRVETSTDSTCWVPSVDYPVLIDRVTTADALQLLLYPNPSTGNFTAYVKLPRVATTFANVQVFDATGVLVYTTSKLIFYGNEIRIPVSITAKGSFFVKMTVNDKTIQQTVIIL